MWAVLGRHSTREGEPVKTGDSVKFPVFRPLSRAPTLFIRHVNLGLAPQALCLRLLRRLRKYHTISTFSAKPKFREVVGHKQPIPRGSRTRPAPGLAPQALCLRLLRRLRNIKRFRLFLQSLSSGKLLDINSVFRGVRELGRPPHQPKKQLTAAQICTKNFVR
jgi:hypothetical protein